MASDSGDGKKKVVVVKKQGDDGGDETNKIKGEQTNIAPLAGPMAAEEKETPVKVVNGGTGAVVQDDKKDLQPLNAGNVLDDKKDTSSKKLVKGDDSKGSADKEKTGASSVKSAFSKASEKDATDRSLDKLAENSVKSDSMPDLKSKDGNKASSDKGIDKATPSDKGGDKSATDKSSASKAAIAGLAYSGSSNASKCAKCSKDVKDCRCLSSTGSAAGSANGSGNGLNGSSTAGSRDSRATIDEGRNKNHRVVGAFVPTPMEAPVPESILCELRRKNSIISEGFGFKKRTFFFCFWVKQYFVLLKTGELLWLETDGSGPGNGNWNVKHGTAFNKFDYEGYSHPHRLTFSSDSSTCYLAFDTEEERNYWLEKLQDVSRS